MQLLERPHSRVAPVNSRDRYLLIERVFGGWGIGVSTMQCETMRHRRPAPRADRRVGIQDVGLIIVVAIIAIALCLCGRLDPSSVGAFSCAGVDYSFPNTVLVREAIYSDTIMVKTDAYTFQVAHQQLFVDGACFGKVKRGEAVVVKQTGEVLVDGVRRTVD
jgi:hypothetical protein